MAQNFPRSIQNKNNLKLCLLRFVALNKFNVFWKLQSYHVAQQSTNIWKQSNAKIKSQKINIFTIGIKKINATLAV